MSATLAIRMDSYADDSSLHYVYTIDDLGFRVMLADNLTAEDAAMLARHYMHLPLRVVALMVRSHGGTVRELPDFPPVPPNEARHGMTVQSLARLFAMYAKDNPLAVVKFTSAECGGRWPEGKGAMAAFTDHQVAVVDATRCGGGVTLSVSLLAFDRPKEGGK